MTWPAPTKYIPSQGSPSSKTTVAPGEHPGGRALLDLRHDIRGKAAQQVLVGEADQPVGHLRGRHRARRSSSVSHHSSAVSMSVKRCTCAAEAPRGLARSERPRLHEGHHRALLVELVD